METKPTPATEIQLGLVKMCFTSWLKPVCVSFLRKHVDNVQYLLLAYKHANLTSFVVLARLMPFIYLFKKRNHNVPF